jgi:hypothetical protein
MFVEHFMEHILGGTHFLLLLGAAITGKFSAPVFTTIGLILFSAFLVLLCRAGLPQKEDRLILAAPVVLLILQFQYYQSLIWPTNIMGVALLHLTALGTFVGLSARTRGGLAASVFCGFAATLTFGSGFLVFPLGFLLLLCQRRFTSSAIWIFFSGAALALFFWKFGDLISPAIPPIALFKTFLRFLGLSLTLGARSHDMIVLWNEGAEAAEILGFVLLVPLVVLFSQRLFDRNPAITGYLLFLLLNMALAARQRGLHGNAQIFQSRYHLYSTLVLACLYLGGTAVFPQGVRRHLPWLMFVALWFNVSSNYSVQRGIERHGKNLAFGYYLSAYKPPTKVTVSQGNELYFPGIYQYEIPLKEGIFVPPIDSFRRLIGSRKVDEAHSTLVPVEDPQVTRLATFDNSLFFEIVFLPAPSDRKREFQVQLLDGAGGTYTAQKFSRLNASWYGLLQYYYPSQDYWIALIPRNEIQAERGVAPRFKISAR